MNSQVRHGPSGGICAVPAWPRHSSRSASISCGVIASSHALRLAGGSEAIQAHKEAGAESLELGPAPSPMCRSIHLRQLRQGLLQPHQGEGGLAAPLDLGHVLAGRQPAPAFGEDLRRRSPISRHA
jgi:hypothetical protein